jgi:hypothetical protein
MSLAVLKESLSSSGNDAISALLSGLRTDMPPGIGIIEIAPSCCRFADVDVDVDAVPCADDARPFTSISAARATSSFSRIRFSSTYG